MRRLATSLWMLSSVALLGACSGKHPNNTTGGTGSIGGAGTSNGSTGSSGNSTNSNSNSGSGSGSDSNSGSGSGSTTSTPTSSSTNNSTISTSSTGGTGTAPVGPSNCVSPPSVDAGAVEALVAGNNQFALSLLGQVGAGAQSNVFLSPYSASAALGMTYAGARDQTATAMMQTLDFPTDGTSLAPAFGSIDCQLVADGTGPDGGQLDLANKLFGQQGFIFQPDFISLLHDNYGSDLQLVDFANDPTAARETINGWVSQQTLGNIPNLLSLDEITSDDVLVLVDAIYFKGAWRTLFDQAQPGNFQVSSQSSVSVPMMYANDYPAPFYQGSNFEVLELPTKGSQIAVDLILPDDVDGLAALESSLTPSSLESTLGSLQPTLVNAYLPKFKLDTSIDLVQTLTDMGMGVAFTGGADFSGIGGTPGQLQILHVQHEAVLDFDEGGIAASGATAVVVGSSGSSGGPPASTFYATHPFLIVIRDVNNGSILFMGQVVDPSHT